MAVFFFFFHHILWPLMRCEVNSRRPRRRRSEKSRRRDCTAGRCQVEGLMSVKRKGKGKNNRDPQVSPNVWTHHLKFRSCNGQSNKKSIEGSGLVKKKQKKQP